MKGSNPFTYVESINYSKRHLMKGTANDDLAERDYVPFLTNRNLSYFPDTLGDANTINRLWALPARMQYDYLFYSVRPRRRYAGKWAKPFKNADYVAIKRVFNVGYKKALEIYRTLTPDQMKQVHQYLIEGGKP